QFGGVDYITKPFQVEEVLARTETHLALRRLQERQEKINQRMQRELTLAGAVQSSFLPSQMPEVEGWQFLASLQSARETSGDFYDVIQLPNGRLGLLIADVVDKGVPAALLMALSWSLVWNYAIQYPDSPQTVFAEVNRRLLMHLGGSQFFTCFYGVLNPENGTLVYTNAGQPPPFHLKQGKKHFDTLGRTGPPLGVLEEGQWDQVEVALQAGETLILYTDGVTDACNARGELYGVKRLRDLVERKGSESAQALHDALLADIDNFVAGELQYDDTALVIAQRK
ncbi:MAG: response regulator, partial [Anaerolineales bacterium]